MTQAILQTWEKTFKYQFVTRMETLARFRNQLSDVLKTIAQRAYTSLSVNKEEEIRAWWRVQQEEKRVFWTRRGYSDAQHGTNGYPHHGTCYCAWCQAYWAGYGRFQHGEAQEANLYAIELSPLGFLSPPPRKEIISRAAKSLAHAKKQKVNQDVVIQIHPAMSSASFDALTVGAGTLFPEPGLTLPTSKVSQGLQPQGQWELPTQRIVKTVSSKKTRRTSTARITKFSKTSQLETNVKRATPTTTQHSKQSKILMSA